MSSALTSTRSRLPVARRNGVGMYTVTAMNVSILFAVAAPAQGSGARRSGVERARPAQGSGARRSGFERAWCAQGLRRPTVGPRARVASSEAEVALAGVRQHGDDELFGRQIPGDGARREGGGAPRDPHE